VTFCRIIDSRRFHAIPDVATMPSRLGQPVLTPLATPRISIRTGAANPNVALLSYEHPWAFGLPGAPIPFQVGD
jgi:hypothetical protein